MQTQIYYDEKVFGVLYKHLICRCFQCWVFYYATLNDVLALFGFFVLFVLESKSCSWLVVWLFELCVGGINSFFEPRSHCCCFGVQVIKIWAVAFQSQELAYWDVLCWGFGSIRYVLCIVGICMCEWMKVCMYICVTVYMCACMNDWMNVCVYLCLYE